MSFDNKILKTIGKTPLVQLRGDGFGERAKIYAKLEMFNPGGSVKDRPALNMIIDAEKRGVLDSRTTVIEATSGNTGIALSMICAARGYKCIIVMPQNMSIERIKTMGAYGAKIELTPVETGMKGALARVEELREELSNTFIPAQFDNPANPAAHEFTTGPEIIEALGHIDAFVIGIGTGGTITGVARAFRKAGLSPKIIGIEPEESAVIKGNSPGKHGIQGIGAGFIPKNLDQSLIDEVLTVSTQTALNGTRRLAKREGIFGGISSGAAYMASLQIAEEMEEGKTIVTLFPDSGFKYLSMEVF